MMDNNYRTQRINDLLEEMYGYLPEEIGELKRKISLKKVQNKIMLHSIPKNRNHTQNILF
ncbi:MAG: hypothetical protein IPH28_25135 [Cytophagaceae bacterium]|nr:hypothetical protein [Cytophagaceae bacterium]